MKSILPFILVIIMFISSCSKQTTEPDVPHIRWNLIPELGTEMMTGLFKSDDGSKLIALSGSKYARFDSSSPTPVYVKDLAYKINDHDSLSFWWQFNPKIYSDYFFYCNHDGQRMYVCDTDNGELSSIITIDDFVSENNKPARFMESSFQRDSNHIERSDDLFMISIKQRDPEIDFNGDDKLYFCNLIDEGSSLDINILQIINSYESPVNSEYMFSNFYYKNHFWQYRNCILNPPMTRVNKEDFSTEYLSSSPEIRDMFSYNDHTLAVVDNSYMKSYDDGVTLEEWITLNAPWNIKYTQYKYILFYSHNYSSMDLETLEIINYDKGELYGSVIIELEEFNGLIYAITAKGMYYATPEDCFVPKDDDKKNRDEISLRIVDLL